MIKHLNSGQQGPRRVVILGSSGFVGKELSRTLGNCDLDVLGIASKDLDLCSTDSVGRLKALLRDTDALVFASALTPDKGKDARTMMKNLLMAEHVGNALEQAPCHHVVYISSDAVYDEAANPVREAGLCDSGGLYGHMHRGREIIMKTALAKARTPLLILRPTALYGAGDTHRGYGPNRFLRTALQDKQIALFGNGDEKRDHLHIDDFTRLIQACLMHRSEGLLNVASGTSVPFHEVASAVADIVGGDIEIKRSPQTNPVTHRHFDITELLRAFPDFRLTPLKQGLTATYQALS